MSEQALTDLLLLAMLLLAILFFAMWREAA